MSPAELEKALKKEFDDVYRLIDHRIDGRIVKDRVRRLAYIAYKKGYTGGERYR